MSLKVLPKPSTITLDTALVKKANGCEFLAVRSAAQPEQIEGYLALWGDDNTRDCYQTYFDRDKPPQMDLQEFLPLPLRYGHGQDESMGKGAIGKVIKVWVDDFGIRFQALLDRAAAGYQRVADEIKRGILGVSTGTAEYLAEFDDSGRFVSWPVAEVSLTDSPCESRMPSVTAIRSLPLVPDKPGMPGKKRLELAVKSEGTDLKAEYQAAAIDDLRDCECEPQVKARTSAVIAPIAPTRKLQEGKMQKQAKRAGAVTAPVHKQQLQQRASARDPGPGQAMADGAATESDTDAPVTQRIGLTMGALGLDANATIQDIYEAMCGLLGESGASAVMSDAMGGGDSTDSLDDSGLDGMDEERELPGELYDDPENDSRPVKVSEFSNDPEVISTNGRSSGHNGGSGDFMAQLSRMISDQQRSAVPRSSRRPASTMAQHSAVHAAQPSRLVQLEAENKRLRRELRDAPVDDPTGYGSGNGSTRGTSGTGNSNSTSNAGNIPTFRSFNPKDLAYDGSSAADLSYVIRVLEARGKPVSDSLYRATSMKIAAEIEKGTAVGSDLTVQYMTPFRSRSDVMQSDIRGMRRMMATRAGEVMGDANSGFGSNYVGVFYDTSLWLKVRAQPIWRELEARGMEEKVIPVGYASDVIPLEGADFSWYRVPETVDIDATGRPKINIPPSKAGTGSQTLTVRTLGALVYYSVLVEEDSIVPMAAELNRKANIEAQENIEFVVFNGDTATGSTNLNLKNGTVNTGDVYNYTVADGMLKAGIYGNSGLNARQSAGLSELDYQLLFAKLNNNGITGSDPSKLLFIVDPYTGLASDRLPIFKTMDVYNPATILNGRVSQVFGVPIFRSGQIYAADATGYIDSVTPANNKFGRIGLVRPDQWVIGFKRQITMEFFRDAPGQSNGLVITLRFGLVNRDATQAASASYNVAIA